MEIVYREFDKSDFLNFFALVEDEWKDMHNSLAWSVFKADNDVEQCILALDDQKIVGYIYGFILPNKTLLPEFLYVLPDYRKQGIGAKLLSKFEKNSGCTVSRVYYNKDLHDFYNKSGYMSGDRLEVAIKEIPLTEERDGHEI